MLVPRFFSLEGIDLRGGGQARERTSHIGAPSYPLMSCRCRTLNRAIRPLTFPSRRPTQTDTEERESFAMSCFFALTTWLICLRSAERGFCHSGPEVCGGWDKRSFCLLVLCQNRKLSRSQRHRFMSGKIRISCPQSGGGEGKSQTEQGNLLRRVVCCVSLWVERCQNPFFCERNMRVFFRAYLNV